MGAGAWQSQGQSVVHDDDVRVGLHDVTGDLVVFFGVDGTGP
jgi:hypothetical protein